MEQTVGIDEFSHTDLLNHLIAKYGYKTYLEIGVGDPRENFCQIACDDKIGVDPYCNFVDVPNYDEKAIDEINKNVKFRLTSDEFFNYLREDITFDLIFIDGLHTEEQCDRDIQNALNHLSENGSVVVHDTCPYSAESAEERPNNPKGFTWNGDIYKSICKLKSMNIWYITVGFDYGITVIKRHKGFVKNDNVQKIELSYETFDEKREQLLNMVSGIKFLNEI